MDEPLVTAFGQKSLTEDMRKFQVAETVLLKGIFSDNSKEGRLKELKVLLGAIVSTSVAISRLANEDLLNECTMLGRAFFERVVNFCCLMVCDDEKFNEYKEHFIQKAFRKLSREFRAGTAKMSVNFSGKIDLDQDPELASAIGKYTTSKGSEKHDFLRMKIPEKLDLIGKNSTVNIGFFLHYQTLFYEDGSEALHGSFYGSIFHLGAAQPGFDPENIEAANIHLQKMLSLLLLDIGTLIHQLLIIIDMGEKIEKVLKASEHNFDMAGKILKIGMKAEK